ncbi:MAG: DUF4384 domain-containing protein [Acidobacteriota bacterium]
MRTGQRLLTLIALLIVWLFFYNFIIGLADGQGSSLVWDKPQNIKRVGKPKRAKPRVHVEHVPLLTLEWRVLKRNDGGSGQETNPKSIFHTGDRLRLVVKANQPGYLYIIHNSEGQDGTLLFPDSRINNGKNFIQKDQEYILPAYCPTPEFDDPHDCWWRMTPPGGAEEFTLIFSRDMIIDLPNEIIETGRVIVRLKEIQELKSNTKQKLQRTSRPNLSPIEGGGAGRYVTWVTNTNTKDNEELIETLVLVHTGHNGSTNR